MTTAAPTVKERPILMHARSINGILKGRKRQTRRIVKATPIAAGPDWSLWYDKKMDTQMNAKALAALRCSYGKPGDRLWVRETFKAFDDGDVFYRADFGDSIPVHADDEPEAWHWQPSIFMPRWASRLMLEIVDIRVERIQDISPDDCIAEGVTIPVSPKGIPLLCLTNTIPSHKLWRDNKNATGDGYITGNFALLWNDTNGKGAWERNDFVWVLSFRKVQ